jgi:amidase
MTIVVEELFWEGPGLTVMVKDTIDVAGSPTRASSAAFTDASNATAHAEVVSRLLNAGHRLIGKTSLHELAFGTTGINHFTGTAANPRFAGRIPGGSSSGSAAAVAAGLADFTLGTDTGGSVRIPACCCGVFGFKPTFGRVSRQGVMPRETSLDCVGPFAASLPMLETAMDVIDPTYRRESTPERVNIGVIGVKASEPVQQVFEATLNATGQLRHVVELPSFEAAYDAAMAVINRETFAAWGHLLASGQVGADVAARLAAAQNTSDDELAEAETIRKRFSAEVDAALREHDVLALPTMPAFPPLVSEASDTRALLGMTAFVRPFNLSGHPAVTLPLTSPQGLPVGLQLIGAKGADEALLAAARLLLSRLYS